jgi:hypothetical protein
MKALIIVAGVLSCTAIANAFTPDTDVLLSKHRSWHLVNAKRYFVPERTAELCRSPLPGDMSPHGDKYISVYVNKAGEQTIAAKHPDAYPAGTVLVKEKYAAPAGGEPEIMTIMIKREKGFNPKGGDWEYAVAGGKGVTFRERGKLPKCQSCHASRKTQDFVFRTYRPGGPKNAWDEGPLLPTHGN